VKVDDAKQDQEAQETKEDAPPVKIADSRKAKQSVVKAEASKPAAAKDPSRAKKVLGENKNILNQADESRSKKDASTKQKKKVPEVETKREVTPFEDSEIEPKTEFTIASKVEVETKRARMTHLDLDTEDIGDVGMATAYVEDIVTYWRELETKSLPVANYMNKQKELDWSMRTTLIDWIIEVHNKLVLLPETLFLTVNVIDRFLSAKPVSVGKLQLVGVAALLIACKYEEIYCPAVKQLQFLTDDAFHFAR